MRPLTICLALLLNSGVGTLSESAGANDSGSAATKVKETTGPLRLLRTIELPGIEGDFDHFGVDLKGGRLFLTAEDHSSVEVFDLKTGKHIHSINGLKTPHYVRFLPEQNKLLVVDGGVGEVKFLKGDNYEPIDSAKLLLDADSSAFDTPTGYLYTVNGGKDTGNMDYSTIAITDTKADKHLGDIRINSPQVEAIALEKSGPRIFVNGRAHSQVAVVDREKRALVATWPISGGQNNVPMALDEPHHRLFLVTLTNPQFTVLDTVDGKQIASLPSSGGADDMFFDAARRRICVSTLEGFIMVYGQKDPDNYELMAKVPSAAGGMTSIFVPELNRFYVAVSCQDGPKLGQKSRKYRFLITVTAPMRQQGGEIGSA